LGLRGESTTKWSPQDQLGILIPNFILIFPRLLHSATGRGRRQSFGRRGQRFTRRLQAVSFLLVLFLLLLFFVLVLAVQARPRLALLFLLVVEADGGLIPSGAGNPAGIVVTSDDEAPLRLRRLLQPSKQATNHRLSIAPPAFFEQTMTCASCVSPIMREAKGVERRWEIPLWSFAWSLSNGLGTWKTSRGEEGLKVNGTSWKAVAAVSRGGRVNGKK